MRRSHAPKPSALPLGTPRKEYILEVLPRETGRKAHAGKKHGQLRRLLHGCAERHERKPRHFEALPAERYADNGYAPQAAENKVAKRQLQPGKQDPKHIGNERNATAAVNDLPAERKECKPGKLEALQTDGNAEDRHAPQAARERPCQPAGKPSEKEPKNIPERLQNRHFPTDLL